MSPSLAEEHSVFGRTFTVTIDGPDGDRRFSAYVREVPTGRLLTRTPVRGRSVDDVRDRALEVMRNLLGIERIHEEIVTVAAERAPGASVELAEDAKAIYAELSGPWVLEVPFAVPRNELDEELDLDALRRRIREHFQSHLRAV